jgi:hypothetical protein
MTTEAATPATPTVAKPAVAPAAPGIITRVETDVAWIKLHFIAIFFFLALLVAGVIGSVSLIEHIEEAHDARVAAADLQKENVDTQTVQNLMTQLAQEHAADEARDAQQQATIQALITQMAQQHAVTAKQVSTDASLDAQAAASRLVAQTKSSPSDVTVNNDNVTMTLPMTRTVVADMDLFAQAQSDVTNLNGQLDAQKILTSDAKTELGTTQQVVTADKVELIATIKADNAACIESTKKAVDAEAKKGHKRTFWSVLATAVGVGLWLK